MMKRFAIVAAVAAAMVSLNVATGRAAKEGGCEKQAPSKPVPSAECSVYQCRDCYLNDFPRYCSGTVELASTSENTQVQTLIQILETTQSPGTLVATAIALMPLGKTAQPAVPAILRNAERLKMLDVDPDSVKGDLASTLIQAVFAIQASWNADDAINRGLVFTDNRAGTPMGCPPMPPAMPGAIGDGLRRGVPVSAPYLPPNCVPPACVPPSAPKCVPVLPMPRVEN